MNKKLVHTFFIIFLVLPLMFLNLSKSGVTKAATTYTVRFLGDSGNEISSQQVPSGGAATAPTPPHVRGAVFIRWSQDFSKITSDLSVYTVYDIVYYTANFLDMNNNVINSQLVRGEYPATAPTPPVVHGYTFSNWDKTFDNITSDLTIKAVYSKVSYTVNFKNYDGTVLKTQSVPFEEAAAAPENPSKPGDYVFTGWNKTFNSISDNTDITAVYTDSNHVVNFKDYNGTILKTESVPHGSAATPPINLARTGYTFTNWDTSFSNITSAIDITALYSINNYTVTFKGPDNSVISTATVPFGSSATSPNPPNKTGYTFANWDADFSNVVSDITVNSVYSINKFTVTFVNFDDSVIGTPQLISYGSSANTPIVPLRLGYVFSSWSTDFSNITSDLIVRVNYVFDNGRIIIIPSQSNVSGSSQSKIDYENIINNKNIFKIDSPLANFSIPANVINLASFPNANYLKLNVSPITNTDKGALIDRLPSDKKVVSSILNIQLQLFDSSNALIQDIHQFLPNSNVISSIKLTDSSLKDIDTNRLLLYFYNETTNSWELMGGIFNKDTKEFSFSTTHFSDFLVVQNTSPIPLPLTEASVIPKPSETVQTPSATQVPTTTQVPGVAQSPITTIPQTGSILDTNLLTIVGLTLILLGSVLILRKSIIR